MRRVVIFLLTNFAILVVLSFSTLVLGIDRYLTGHGLNMEMMLAFAALIVFGGSLVSLLMPKTMAKWSIGAQVIEQPSNRYEAWMLDTVERLANKAGLFTPEVAIHEGAPNAFSLPVWLRI